MKKLKNLSWVILVVMMMVGIVIPIESLATDNPKKVEVTEAYKKWAENYENGVINPDIPRPMSTGKMYFGNEETPLDSSEKNSDELRTWAKSGGNYNLVYASATDSSFDLRSVLSGWRVEDQMNTNSCWAFATTKSFETNIAMLKHISLPNYSERHMEYGTVETFTDGKNPFGYYGRVPGSGGNGYIGINYLTNTMGSVTEANMPFVNSEAPIPLSNINKPRDKFVTDSIEFTSIGKVYQKDSSGNTTKVTYVEPGVDATVDLERYKINDNEVKAIRKKIKEHIVKYGSISTHTIGNGFEYMDGSYYDNSTNFNCNVNTYNVTSNHAVSIIGWDDNYPASKFVNGHRPSSNGAYLVLNSYGSDVFNNGVFYVSYEDAMIEDGLVGVVSTSDIDYTRVEQSNKYDPELMIPFVSTTYVSVGFDRSNPNKTEKISHVGFYLNDAAKGEIYICPSKKTTKISDCTKVATFSDLDPGYHRIDVTDTTLSGSSYTIMFKIMSSDGQGQTLTFESPVPTAPGTAYYNNVEKDVETKTSEDNGVTWQTITEQCGDIDLFNRADFPVKVYLKEMGSCTVKHSKEKIGGGYETETEVVTGAIGTTATPAVRTYEGFTSPSAQTITFTSSAQTIEYTYNRKSYTLTVNKDTGIDTCTSGGSIKYGTSVTLSSTAKAGYQTKGFSGDYTSNFTMPAKNVTIRALAEPITYKISYTLNGGTASGNPTTYTVENAVTINDPTKTGYVFDGWTGTGLSGKTKGLTIPKGSTGDRSYTANFSPINYKIAFNSNGGQGTMTNQDAVYDTNVTLKENTFTKEGAFFSNWNTKADGSGTSYGDKAPVKNLTTTNNGTATLYAQWIENQYIIIFDKNGGQGTMGNQSIEIGKPTPLTQNAYTRTGYTFKEWNTKADGTGTKYTDKQTVTDISTTPGTRITLYAIWTPNKYTVKYNGNGGTGEIADQSATYDQNITISTNSFTKTGYKFNGWNTKADGSGDNYSAGQQTNNLTSTNNGTVTLYVKWAPITYTIKFNPTTGTGSMDNQSFKYDEEKALSANTFTKEGYTFESWNTKEDYSGDSYTDKKIVKNLTSTDGKTINLYAKWDKNFYYIAYDKNGGSGDNIENQKVYFDDDAQIKTNTYTKKGYHFKEWNTKADGTGTKYTEGQGVRNLLSTVGETYQLYAIWEANTYTIKFNANKGTGTMQDMSATYDQDVTLTQNAFTRNGYTYDGWNTKADGSGTAHQDKATVRNLTATNGGTVTLYAKWNPITYSITYELNGGTNSSDNPTEYTPETEAFTLKEPTKDLFVFTGWTGSNGETPQKTVKIEKGSYGDKNYAANWEDRYCTYTVKHMQEQLDGTFKVKDTVEDEVKIMTEVTPEVKTYTGFNSPETQTVTINDDGIVVEYKYTRKSYEIRITKGKGIANVSGEGTYKYGETVNIQVEYEPGYTGAKFDNTSFKVGEDFAMPAQTLNLNVEGRCIVYTITYDLGGGSVFGNPNTYTIETDTIVLIPPTRDGFTFIGWTGSLDGNSGTIPKGSMGDRHFVAQWEIPEMTFGEEYNYSVEHYKQTLAGGYPLYPSDKDVITAPEGTIVGPEPKTYEGFETPQRQSAKIEGPDQVIKYYYPRKSYTVSIEVGAGVHKAYGEGTYKYGSRVFLSATPEDPSSEIVFMMNGVRVDEDFRMPAHDVSVKAIALGASTNTKYRITYDLDGGEEYLNPLEYTSQDEIKLYEPRRSGYSFIGWTGSNGDFPEKDVTIPKGSSGNKEYKANWKLIDFDLVFEYTLEEYLENIDGTYNSEPYGRITYEGKRGDTISPEPREYQGFTSPERQTIKLEGDSPKTIRYYYQRNTYRLTIDQGQGVKVLREGLNTRYKYGEEFTIKAELLNGYENLRWTENGKILSEPYTSMPPRDVTIHVGATPITYYISYDLNGGTNVNNPIKYTIEDEYAINNPVKDGYTFTGWTGSNGDTPQKDITIAKGSTGDKSYVANWKKADDQVSGLDIAIGFNTIDPTNEPVVTTIFSNKPLKKLVGWTLSNDKLKMEKKYTENGEELIDIYAESGEKVTAKIIVSNIDQNPPKVSINYNYPTGSQKGVVTLVSNEKLKGMDGWYTEDYLTFTKEYDDNTEESVRLVDTAGNAVIQKVAVTNVKTNSGAINTSNGSSTSASSQALMINTNTVGATSNTLRVTTSTNTARTNTSNTTNRTNTTNTAGDSKANNNIPKAGTGTKIGLFLVIPLGALAAVFYVKSRNERKRRNRF